MSEDQLKQLEERIIKKVEEMINDHEYHCHQCKGLSTE